MKDFGLKKLYYSISEVSKITGLEQYILRYWENEFEELTPSKNRAGNRIYTNKDIRLINYIKKLLREEKYTIDGAKKILKNEYASKFLEEVPQKETERTKVTSDMDLFTTNHLKHDLEKIREFLIYLRKHIT